MEAKHADAFVIARVHGTNRSLTPAELMATLMGDHGLTRRKARACLTRCVQGNHLTYRQQLGRTVVVPSLNRYHPLTRGVVLAPPHLPHPADGTHCITMKEGISFGNGTHPTTMLCAGLIMKAARNAGAWRKALDLGTGTGVLSLLVLKLGCRHVDATEIDPIAMHDARENAVLNGCSHRLDIHHAHGFSPTGTYQMVTANLRFPTLVSLEAAIRGWLEPDGDLILSGIKEGEEAKVKAAYAAHFALKAEKSCRGWVGLHLKKQTPT